MHVTACVRNSSSELQTARPTLPSIYAWPGPFKFKILTTCCSINKDTAKNVSLLSHFPQHTVGRRTRIAWRMTSIEYGIWSSSLGHLFSMGRRFRVADSPTSCLLYLVCGLSYPATNACRPTPIPTEFVWCVHRRAPAHSCGSSGAWPQQVSSIDLFISAH